MGESGAVSFGLTWYLSEEKIPESTVGMKQCAVIVAQDGCDMQLKMDANAPRASMNLESRTLESSPGLAAISQQLRLTQLNIRSFPEPVSRFSGNRTEPINTMGFTTGFVSIFLRTPTNS